MELRDLAYFRAIVEAGHLGRAAEQVGRTQPALTKSVRRLEAALDAQLFERAGRGLKLTSVGEALLARTTYLQRALEMAVREVGDLARGDAGLVKIGSGATTAEYLLPKVTAQLLRDAPGVKLELVVGMSDVLRALLREGEIHLAIVPLSSAENEFASVVAMEDEAVVAARADHPLVGRKVNLAELLEYPWVLAARSVTMRQWLDTVFEAEGLPLPTTQVQTNSISLLPTMIAKTDHLTFISRKSLGPGTVGASLSEIQCSKTTLRRKLCVLYRQGVYLPPAARHFIDLVSKMRKGAAYPAGGDPKLFKHEN